MDYQVVGNFKQSQSTIGVAAAQIAASGGKKAYLEVTLKADDNNANVIYIGASSGVTTANGYPLIAGETLKLKLSTPRLIWAISGAAAQILHIIET